MRKKMKTRHLTFLAFAFLFPGPAAPALDGTVVYTDGRVSIYRDSDVMDADIGMTVVETDVIETGEGSFAVIDLGGGAEVKLRESTRLALEALGEKITVQLAAGGVFSRVKQKLNDHYFVKAEAVSAGVRGTDFFVAFGRTIDETPDVWLCVNDGSVEVNIDETDQKTIVEAGEGINIVAGSKLTRPRFYPWTKKLNWNMDPSSGMVADRTDLDEAYSDLLDQDYD